VNEDNNLSQDDSDKSIVSVNEDNNLAIVKSTTIETSVKKTFTFPANTTFASTNGAGKVVKTKEESSCKYTLDNLPNFITGIGIQNEVDAEKTLYYQQALNAFNVLSLADKLKLLEGWNEHDDSCKNYIKSQHAYSTRKDKDNFASEKVKNTLERANLVFSKYFNRVTEEQACRACEVPLVFELIYPGRHITKFVFMSGFQINDNVTKMKIRANKIWKCESPLNKNQSLCNAANAIENGSKECSVCLDPTLIGPSATKRFHDFLIWPTGYNEEGEIVDLRTVSKGSQVHLKFNLFGKQGQFLGIMIKRIKDLFDPRIKNTPFHEKRDKLKELEHKGKFSRASAKVVEKTTYPTDFFQNIRNENEVALRRKVLHHKCPVITNVDVSQASSVNYSVESNNSGGKRKFFQISSDSDVPFNTKVTSSTLIPLVDVPETDYEDSQNSL
jgi:hypothetical protein